MYATLLLDTKKIIFEVLESPISNLWMDSLNKWNAASSPMKVVTQYVPYAWSKTNAEDPALIVSKIQEAIDNINQVVEGEKFPYVPYLDMPWEQTNLLHRCFTTSMASMKCWKHNFSTDQLLKGKTKTMSKVEYVTENTKQTFTVKQEDISFLRKNLSSLNKWVHFFEDTKPSLRAVNLFKDYPEFNSLKYGYAELEWDTYDEYGQRTMLGMNLASYKDILETFNNPKSDECDVFISKAIMGKDYETSYFQFDDPLEIDTTNVHLITGGIRIFNKVYYNTLFGNNGAITNWTKERGLHEAMVRQIPIGKIIHQDVDFNELEASRTETYTCGAQRALGVFSSPRIYLSEKLDN